jgi:hypothetical protein
MPRPNKSGLDYFPLDVDLDDKIELIEAKHGLLAFGFIIKLFQAIYKNGYYIEASEDRLLLISKRVNVDINFTNAVIADALKWKLFDDKIYNKYNILTSCGIQKRYIEATKRRKEVDFYKEFLLTDPVKLYQGKVNVNIIKINADINSKKDDDNPQSKVKESKEYIYVETSVEVTLAKELLEKIKTNYPGHKYHHTPPNIQTWAHDIHLILRLDKRPAVEIKKILDWSQRDSFWMKNIWSTKKLREKFDRLRADMAKRTGQEPLHRIDCPDIPI